MIYNDIKRFLIHAFFYKSDSSIFISVLLKYIVISGGFWR